MSAIEFDFTYSCEYAKSGRAGCKKCKKPIDKDSLRLAFMTRSPFFDGKVPNWHHYDCFFMRYKPKNVGEIKNFEHLRFEDQKRIKESLEKITNGNIIEPIEPGKGKKRKPEAIVDPLAKEFTVEYAKSNRSACKLCENNIDKDELRIGKLDHESEDAGRFGPLNRWYHVDCFRSAREELGFHWSANVMNNFKRIEKTDQKILLKMLPPITKTDDVPAKQPKMEIKEENEHENGKNGQENVLKKQSDLLFKYVDELKQLKKPEIHALFEHNNLTNLPNNLTRMIEFLADALAFGLPEKCPTCGGCLNFKISQYICYGNIDGWSRCGYTTENPKRTKLKIPKDLKKFPFLSKYKFKEKQRIIDQSLKESFQNTLAKEKMKEMKEMVKKEENDEVEIETSKPLCGYNVACFGVKLDKDKVENLGGKYAKEFERSVLCIISKEEYLKKTKAKKLDKIKELKIPVVTEEFFNLLSNEPNLQKALNGSKISFWDLSDEKIEERIQNLNVVNKIQSTFRSGSSKLVSGKSKSVKMIVKDGSVVDPDSQMQDIAHLYRQGNDIYNAVLNLVDLAINKNSFYKIQLLEDDRFNGNYWLFKSWGRIGTNVGGTKLESFKNKQDAIKAFEDTYFERTKNEWKDRDHFVKHPYSYYPVEIDYGECCDTTINVEESKSLLPNPVKQLISLLFDIQAMKKTMLEFELDLDKMPLGKISKNKILEACSTLKEISNLLNMKTLDMNQLTSACTKFYSLVPHNFGLNRPPLIMSQEVVSKKNEMLESLMEIELAYDIIRNKKDDNNDEDVIDFNYKKLKADIEPLDKNDVDYKLIHKYIHNTHAETHNMYTLEIVNVFKVVRHGEHERFAEFADNPNRMLLWHGSRLTNFVGIISQGLRIAPKEAPVTGYMFGKGVYFADCVSKSANYCYTSPDSNVGLLALSEVAIGNSMELTEAKNVTKLKKQFQSVKGIGSSHPDPNEIVVMADGVKVPIGKLIKNTQTTNTSLLYNEYIIYNEKQVKIRYLVQVKFNYKSLF